MARVDVDQIDVIEAVVLRLQTTLKLPESRCYPVARPQDVPKLPPGGDYFLTVAPGNGNFAEEEQVPGIAATDTAPAQLGNITEDTEVIVSGYTRIKTDQTGHDAYLLLDEARGLMAIKKAVLGALVGQDLTDAAGDTFLRQLIHARRCDAPEPVEVGRDGVLCGVVRITLGTVFDWLLP